MKYEVADSSIIERVRTIITEAQANAVRSVDYQRVLMYWNIGREIFEEEQQGADRAEYGAYLIKRLSAALHPDYGTSVSTRQLERCRQFYKEFPIASAVRTQFSWTHYKLLLPLGNSDKRTYYIAESTKNNWSARQLERQINCRGAVPAPFPVVIIFERGNFRSTTKMVGERAREGRKTLPLRAS